MSKENFHFTMTTTKKLEEAAKSIETTLKDEGFGVLWSFDVHQKLEEKGFTTDQKITIMEVCNPKEASDIISVDPMVSYFLPCKIIVSEEKEHTKIGLLSPKVLIGFIENEKLDQLASEIEERLAGAIKRAV